jgi:hypothetical protein
VLSRLLATSKAFNREKTNVGIVVSHCPLLRDNSRYLKRFLPSLGCHQRLDTIKAVMDALEAAGIELLGMGNRVSGLRRRYIDNRLSRLVGVPKGLWACAHPRSAPFALPFGERRCFLQHRSARLLRKANAFGPSRIRA